MTIELALHPEFAENGGFGHLRLGRIKPAEPPKLRLAKYVDEAVVLPATPPTTDFYSDVPSWPMYENDSLGDCTCAAPGHMVQAWSAAAGGLKTMDDADVVRMYWETGDPPSDSGSAGGPTDTGRDEMSVLDYWRKQGIAAGQPWADKITAYAGVEASNLDLVKAAIALFGGVYIGVALPLTAQGQQVWDVVAEPGRDEPGSWGGHAVNIVGYDENELVVVTWGGLLKMTNAFFEKYVDEVYAVLSPDFLGAGSVSPAGFDLAALEADLTALTGSGTGEAETAPVGAGGTSGAVTSNTGDGGNAGTSTNASTEVEVTNNTIGDVQVTSSESADEPVAVEDEAPADEPEAEQS